MRFSLLLSWLFIIIKPSGCLKLSVIFKSFFLRVESWDTTNIFLCYFSLINSTHHRHFILKWIHRLENVHFCKKKKTIKILKLRAWWLSQNCFHKPNKFVAINKLKDCHWQQNTQKHDRHLTWKLKQSRKQVFAFANYF